MVSHAAFYNSFKLILGTKWLGCSLLLWLPGKCAALGLIRRSKNWVKVTKYSLSSNHSKKICMHGLNAIIGLHWQTKNLGSILAGFIDGWDVCSSDFSVAIMKYHHQGKL